MEIEWFEIRLSIYALDVALLSRCDSETREFFQHANLPRILCLLFCLIEQIFQFPTFETISERKIHQIQISAQIYHETTTTHYRAIVNNGPPPLRIFSGVPEFH